MKINSKSQLRFQSAGRPNSLVGLIRKGFSLLEIIVVIGIIGVIVGVGVVMIGNAGDTANIAMTETMVKGVVGKCEEYKILGGRYPTQNQGLQSLVTRPTTAPTPKRWNELYPELPLDPWGNDLKYFFPGRKKANKPEVVSAGPNGIFEDEDDISSQD